MRIYRQPTELPATKKIRSPKNTVLEPLTAILPPWDDNPGTEPAVGRSWRLFFPARLGPPRKKSKVVAGVKVTGKVRTMELPPTKNTRHGNPHSQAAWIKEWREEAKRVANAADIPVCSKIRLSAVVYRRSIGKADCENDHARLAALQDGLVDAGVIVNDTYAYCERGEVREERADVRGVGILLIIEDRTTTHGAGGA